jgi:hypothetical protein
VLPGDDRQGHSKGEAVPHVGIFWMVADPKRDVLVTDSVPLTEAEPYGDCLTHPRGHYEVWDRWRQHGSAWLYTQRTPNGNLPDRI